MAENSVKKQPSEDNAWVAGIGMLTILCLAVPALLGGALYFGLLRRRRLTRPEAFLIIGTSVAATALAGGTWFGDYFGWLTALVGFGEHARSDVPYLTLGMWAIGLAAFASLMDGTNIGNAALTRVGMKARPNELEVEAILPSATERDLARSVVVPDGLVVDPLAHSTLVPSSDATRAIPVGLDKRLSPVFISEKEFSTHAFVLGSTGSGKTELLKALMRNLLDLGWDGLLLDLKEDTKPGGLRDFCRRYTDRHAVIYQEFSLSDGPTDYWFDPFYGMGQDEMRDTLLSMVDFDDGYWASTNELMAGQVISCFWDAHRIDPQRFPLPSLYDVAQLLAQDSLPKATQAMRATVIAHNTPPGADEATRKSVKSFWDNYYSALANPSKDEAQSAKGFANRILKVYATHAGRSVLQASEHNQPLDVGQGGLTYMGLDTMGKAELTKMVSAAVLQRMNVYAADRTMGKVPVNNKRFLIIDEANWVNRKALMNLLSRARSAGVVIIVATQSAMDWSDEQGDDWSKIVGNINVGFIGRQGEIESATRCADFIGKRETYQTSQRIIDGELVDAGTARTDWTHRIAPDDIRSMGIGDFVVRVGVPVERTEYVSVKMVSPE